MQMADAIRAIKERINIADLVRRYVELKPNGSRLVAPCPFHQETKPSFSVNPDKGFFYCFGCQASGDIFEFYCKINGVEFIDALENLAQEAGIVLDSAKWDENASLKNKAAASARQQMLKMHEFASRHFIAGIGKENSGECREYIVKRGLSREIVEQFGIGWAQRGWHDLENALRKQGFNLDLACEAGLLGKAASGGFYDRFRGRLIFPIKNLSNQIIAFGGRIIANEDEAKYINSSDTPIYKKKEHLYGLPQARRGISAKGQAILTEGYMDVLTLHQFGYDNSIGVLGTALTDEQIRRIGGFASNVLLLFDGDRAGRKAALRSCEMFLSRGLSCNVAILPESEDIDSLLRGAGKNAFDEIKARAPDGLRFCVDVLQTFAPREAVEWAKNFLSGIQMPELSSRYASALAQHLGIDEQALRAGASVENRRSIPGSMPTAQQMRNMRDTQIMIFAARYPERLADLRDMGADLALCSPAARNLWDLLEQWGPEEVYYHLNEKQKNFWHRQRMPPAAPLTSGDYELDCLGRELTAYYAATQKASLTAALAGQKFSGDFEADLDYLRALQETLEKDNEQS